MNKSPLRYAGGKTRACKILDNILNKYFDIDATDKIISPFFGGGSFEFHIQNNYKLNIIANDKFTPLYHFWYSCKNHKDDMCDELIKRLDTITKEDFYDLRENIMRETDKLKQSIMYFIINRCSFNAATLSGGFSLFNSKKRFTETSIGRIKNLELSKFDIYNLDFEDFMNMNIYEKSIIFLDPPYYLKNSNLYGKDGDMHRNFNHNKLYECLLIKKNWILTYNNCDYIKELYKDFKIIETSWTYGMNKSKKSSEIIIINSSKN